jgi:hypothetical protein
MIIKSLYRDYFQKSRVFLYPLLGIRKGVITTPKGTYIAWDGHYTPGDRKLICTYNLREDKDFIRFEKIFLTGNRLFHDFKLIDDTTGIYVFDFEPHKYDWDNFINGKYSKLTVMHKKRIKEFYGDASGDFAYVESFLYPEKFIPLYSDLLGIKPSVLYEVGELCSILDLTKETLVAEVQPISFKTQLITT